MNRLLPKLYPLLLIALGLLFFVPFLGYAPLFDGVEMRYAEAAREMLVTHTFGYAQLNFLPDYATPPLLPWLQALAMHVFGVADNAELAARLPSALIGVVTMLTLFFIGQKKHDARFGFLWALSYLGAVTPLVLAKSGLPATMGHLFNFLGFLYLFEMLSATQTAGAIRNAVVAGLFFGIAMLTNGAFVSAFMVILLLLTNYVQMTRQSMPVKIRNSLIVLSLPVLCSIIWLVSVPGSGGQQAFSLTHDLSVYPYTLIGMAGILTTVVLSSRYWSAGAVAASPVPEVTLPAWISKASRQAIILVVLAPSGVLLLWFLLAYLTTYHIYQVVQGERAWDKRNSYLLLLTGLFMGLLMLFIPLLGMNPDWLARQTSDPYWVGITGAPVTWNGWEWLIGAALMVLTLFFTLLLRRHIFGAMIGLYLSTAVCALAFLTIVVPKIEQYLQGPLIDFCEAKWNQPVYVQPSFPSYAHLFYTRKKPPVNPRSRDIDWLANGQIDKQTFIITTATDAGRYRYNNNLILEGEEYGYVFFRRKQYR